MYRALYRKWRPQRFEDVVAQRGIVTALRNQVASGRVGHAYLFTGVRGTRSQTRALQMAREAARRAGSPLFAYMAEVTLSFPADVPPAEISRGRHDNTFPWQLVDAGQGHMLRTLRDRVVRAVDPSFPTGPRALENLIGRSPALFFRRFFSCPLFSAVRMVSWTLPKDHGGWSGLHLATVLTPAITGISLLSPSRDLLAGLEGVERRRRLGYLLGTSLSPLGKQSQ